MPYRIYRNLNKVIRTIENERNLTLLRIVENPTLLNYQNLINKHSNLYKEFIENINKTIEVKENNDEKFDISKLAALKGRLQEVKDVK